MRTLDVNTARSWCLVRIDGRPCAFALGAVAEIVEVEAGGLVPLPFGPPLVLGLCPYRRDLLPVIALGTGADRASRANAGAVRPVVLILKGEQGTWGVRIDRGGVVVAEGAIEDRGASQRGPGEAVVRGTMTRDETAYCVIDPDATWRTLRDAIERSYRGDRGPDP